MRSCKCKKREISKNAGEYSKTANDSINKRAQVNIAPVDGGVDVSWSTINRHLYAYELRGFTALQPHKCPVRFTKTSKREKKGS